MVAMLEAMDALEALEEVVVLVAVVAALAIVGAMVTGPTVVGVGAVASEALGVVASVVHPVATASGLLTTAWRIPLSRMQQ